MRILLLFLLFKFTTFVSDGKMNDIIDDMVFDVDLKTVQLYAFGNAAKLPGLSSRVLNMNANDRMVLEFDDLKASYRQFHVKIQHCNRDWTPSRLTDLEYLSDYNDFIINDYQISQNTKIPYFHYGYILPELKASGNYVLFLYEDYISDSPLASLRFSVVNAQVGISANVQQSQDPALWQTHEQVNFELNYNNYSIRDPRNDFEILIRQNYRDETTKTGFKASSLNGSLRTLTYRFFNNENSFPAGNEYRYLDLRSNFNKGDNIAKIKQGREDQVWLVPQSTRSQRTYLESVDLNGRFVVQTLDGDEPATSADYMHVHAGFKSLMLSPNEKLCILGGFNRYNCSETGEMHYDNTFQGYTTTFLLKQGMYDFQFGVVNRDGKTNFELFEGNFSNTKNAYEIFVYHKAPSSKSDLLVGYALIEE